MGERRGFYGPAQDPLSASPGGGHTLAAMTTDHPARRRRRPAPRARRVVTALSTSAFVSLGGAMWATHSDAATAASAAAPSTLPPGTAAPAELFDRRLPRRLWRQVHYASFPLFALATIHGLTAGSDAGRVAAVLVATAAFAAVAALAALRVKGAVVPVPLTVPADRRRARAVTPLEDRDVRSLH